MCIFCKIAEKELPASIIYEDADVLAFNDIAPQAPTHVVVITKKHIACASEVQDGAVWFSLMGAGMKIVKKLGIGKYGYRLVINTGEHGGQTVPHLHLHILAGRNLGWPPG